MTPTVIERTPDPAAWSSAGMKAAPYLGLEFTGEEITEMTAVIAQARARGLSAEDAPDDLFVWPQVHRRMQAVLAEVRDGTGVAVISGLPVERFDKTDLALIYWGLGVAMGRGVSQSAKGDRLGHVRDMSATDGNARAYQNKNELNPHTDHTELVGLMCLRDSLSGGETPLASALAIHNEILRLRPDLLPVLYRGFRYHRRGEQQPGEPDLTPHLIPVFSRAEGKVSCRLVRPYIEAAAIELGEPLSGAAVEALDLVQALARDPAFVLPLRLAPGSVVFFNNYTILHARTPFIDHDDLDRKRHLLRLWLLPDGFRPVVPEIEIYSSRGGVERRRDGTAKAYDWGVGGR